MNIWAIVPVKPFVRAKSRLAPVLSPEQRQVLAESMFRHTIDILKTIERFSGVLVVSRDTKALGIARDHHLQTVQESGAPELNSALLRASQAALLHGAEGVLVLPADLPLVTAEDVEHILHMGRYNTTVVIAPDRSDDGTNALLVNPPGFIPFAFGPGSFRRHLLLAEEANATVKIYRSEHISLDIDTPDDLTTFHKVSGAALKIPMVSTASSIPVIE